MSQLRLVKTTRAGTAKLPKKPPVDRVLQTRQVTHTSGFTYSPPPGTSDFAKPDTAGKWDAEIRFRLLDAVWNVVPEFEMPPFFPISFLSGPPSGVAYRVPKVEDLANAAFDDFSLKSYLQFRPTHQVLEMVPLAGETEAARQKIAWTAFPKRLNNLPRDEAYRVVEELGGVPKTRARMDEYCEWFTHRNSDGKINRIDITSEAPEYWEFLYDNEPDTLLALYRRYISPDVQLQDLADGGVYDPSNKWNTEFGAMHLNQPQNTLGAQIVLAADASVLWAECNTCTPLAGPIELIDCGRYGEPNRASDPTIGAGVNSLVQAQFVVSIEDPVGLFLEDLNTDGWQKPDRSLFTADEIKEVVTYERTSGTGQGKNLRIRVEVPSGWGFALGDCFIGGVPITTAGFLVESSVTVFLVGIAVPGEKFIYEDFREKAPVRCRETWGSGRDERPYPFRRTPLYSY